MVCRIQLDEEAGPMVCSWMRGRGHGVQLDEGAGPWCTAGGGGSNYDIQLDEEEGLAKLIGAVSVME